ncbi:type I methionyl aminopeptidase [Citromicrobium bathyomarinum]|uniref:type I methionyl aminopeptidase n=1 Tax=Sphingomonadales TaxID=204457 RepID=UPI000C652179|nr:type I methionyl aminopeptidase [Citromicrobium sp.]MBO79912.1 type I methionyl aminopeptidase [Citromicrobium sp.]|tara:strand:- start:2574 stop:3341 length:768 start_codon:yes stop_codon:yes gene_type:complete
MVKTSEEIALMRVSGRLLASVFEMLDTLDLAGMSTMQVNDRVERFIRDDLAARPASKGQYGYEYVLNCSINEVVCHGVPSADVILRDGDIVNLDITLEKNGFIADSSKTYLVGNVSPQGRRIARVAQDAMWAGIRAVRPGASLGDVGHAIEEHAKKNGCSVVREYCGHGIGRDMHEEPQVLNHGRPGRGLLLREGMTFTIEPMVNLGRAATVTLDDGWTVVTRDAKLSAQFEHTVAVTANGVEVLTLRQDETAPA